MQRRAAALYVAFFVLVGAASYTLIATAEEPSVEIENPEYSLSANESFTLDGQQYTLSNVQGGEAPTAQLRWTNRSARYTATWQNNSTVSLGANNTTYRVVIPNESVSAPNAGGNTSDFRLVEQINRSQILANDTNANNETVTRGGQEYVVVNQSGSPSLVPVGEYFPDPRTRQLSAGATFTYQGNQTTVAEVQPQRAIIAWNAPRTNTIDVAGGSNVTVSNTTYLAHFPSNSTLYLTQDFGDYAAAQGEIDEFHEHIIGLWGVMILCGVVVVLLIGLAYLPSRY